MSEIDFNPDTENDFELDFEDDEWDKPYIIEHSNKFSLSLIKEGEPIKDEWFDSIITTEYSNSDAKCFVVEKNGKFKIINKSMEDITDFVLEKFEYYEVLFSNSESFRNDCTRTIFKVPKYICVKKGGKFGILNLDGKIVVPLKYDYVITPASFEAFAQECLFSDILCVFYIDKRKPTQKVGFLAEYPIVKGNKKVIIDTYIDAIFDDWHPRIAPFEVDNMDVTLNGKKGYLDINGQFTTIFPNAYIGIESACDYKKLNIGGERSKLLHNEWQIKHPNDSYKSFLNKNKRMDWLKYFFDEIEDQIADERRQKNKEKHNNYSGWIRPYYGSYARDEMGYSADDIDTIFDGDPDAYWNID